MDLVLRWAWRVLQLVVLSTLSALVIALGVEVCGLLTG